MTDEMMYILGVHEQLEETNSNIEIIIILNKFIGYCKKQGYSNEEILEKFDIHSINEDQNNQAMIDNNERYLERIKLILGK